MYKVLVQPQGEQIEVRSDESLKQALTAAGYPIRSTCGGQGACGECIIKILAGHNHLNTPSFSELSLLGNVFHITGERLSCQTYIFGDVEVDISDHLKEKAPKINTTRVRKKDAVNEMYEERHKKREEKDAKKNDPTKPWEKEKDKSVEKSLGGNRRPKAFNYDPNSNKEE